MNESNDATPMHSFFYIGQYEDRGLCNLPLTLSSTIYSLHYNIIKDEKAFISFKGFIFTFFFFIAAHTRQQTKASPLFNDKSR